MGLFVLFSPDPWECWNGSRGLSEGREMLLSCKHQRCKMNALLNLMSILITAIVLINNSKANGRLWEGAAAGLRTGHPK